MIILILLQGSIQTFPHLHTNHSKLRSLIFPLDSFDISIILHLLFYLIIHSRDRFHNTSAINIQILQTFLKRFSHPVYRLDCLNGIGRFAISKDIQFLKLGHWTAHVLYVVWGTWISPIEEAMPAP